MGVIIVVLVVASIGLPWLLNGLQMPAEPSHQAEIERVEHALTTADSDADIHVEVSARIMDIYRRRIETRTFRG